MTTDALAKPDSTKLEGTFLGIDSSSWMAWTSFYLGFLIAGFSDLNAATELSWKFAVVGAAIALFFASILPIQRHMKFSLLANTYGKPNHLVTDGPFAYSRNPIYVAFFAPLLSLAVFSPIASAVALAFYIFGMNRWVISREERDLEAGFGDDFRAYKARVRRWV